MAKSPKTGGVNHEKESVRLCAQCGHEIEPFSWTCPHCGYTITNGMRDLVLTFATSWLVFTNMLYFTFYMIL